MVFFFTEFAFSQKLEFNAKEFEKKPYSLSGYAEFRPTLFGLHKNTSLYKLKFFNLERRSKIVENNLALLLDGSLQKGISEVFLQINIDYSHSDFDTSSRIKIFQGFISFKPSISLSFYAGKRTLKWGKGYAWNPVAFVERIKNPNEPDLAREGFTMVTANFTKSFSGILKTLSLSPVFIPVCENLNETFGDGKGLNFAAKLYLLFFDTDIDVIYLTGGSKTPHFGIDFSRNITSNFEIHGEFAFIKDFQKRLMDRDGNISEGVFNGKNYLVGLRYLSTTLTTFIFEYLHNETGFNREEIKEYFSFIDEGYELFLSTGDDISLKKALDFKSYQEMNPMKDYFFLRISQREPFGILYLTPAITWMFNISDGSFSLSPELLYKGVTNLELRLKATVLSGKDRSEFGEKQNSYRMEFRMRYYF